MNEKRCRLLVLQRAAKPLEDFDWVSPGPPCEGCGTFESFSFEMHHRQFRSRGGDWVPSNVLLLCKECHGGATLEKLWAQACGFNIHSWENPAHMPVKLWWSDAMMYLDDDGGFVPKVA